jgi:predicted SnoaL-like aldol condensation-catalyzing enzyme
MNALRRRWMAASTLVAGVLATPSAAQGSAACMTEKSRLDRNKQTVRAFYDLAFNQLKPAEAIAQYAGVNYVQHNPEVADGKQGFIDYFAQLAKRYGDKKRVEFIRLVAEDDLVTVHCRHTFREWHGDVQWAGIDIFRLDVNGKVVEHWDVLQKVTSSAVNSNSMF